MGNIILTKFDLINYLLKITNADTQLPAHFSQSLTQPRQEQRAPPTLFSMSLSNDGTAPQTEQWSGSHFCFVVSRPNSTKVLNASSNCWFILIN